MAVTRVWKVYGAEGHRQRESFCESYKYEFSDDKKGVRILEVENSDKTGTNEYTILRITRNTAQECEDELWGQITDGIFENSRTGLIEEITKIRVEFNHWKNGSGYSHSEPFDNIEGYLTAQDYIKSLDNPIDFLSWEDAINVELYDEDDNLMSEYFLEKGEHYGKYSK